MKKYLINKLIEIIPLNNQSVVIDLGSGLSKNFLPLLDRFPGLKYIGIEPDKGSADEAIRLLRGKNATIINQLGYQLPTQLMNSADLVISLSVIEHIKHLDDFLTTSVKAGKPGAHIIHQYDFGHALSPSSLKERFQVFLCHYFPWLIPENKYVAYVDVKRVVKKLEAGGARVDKITRHQMPNHKQLLKFFPIDTVEQQALADEIHEWEFKASEHLVSLEIKKWEKLFPGVCIWARKL